jgi:hypothetical protein
MVSMNTIVLRVKIILFYRKINVWHSARKKGIIWIYPLKNAYFAIIIAPVALAL